ncbi:OmpA family protein [Ochrovirga pacifica]|uniref:OmpA family protein n=1 Tax=Ochrovirga pacifica TaxID=1042376 RepID=UPI000255A284|nr:OmpA family protein [Ochrovirga pacifica]
MKKNIYAIVFLAVSVTTFAQDLPLNPEPGKCYVRCTTPDVYENKEEQVEVKAAYKVLKEIPAEYKTVTEEVLVKEASKRYEFVPAVWGTETVEYVSKDASNMLTLTPASFKDSTVVVEVKPAYARWELSPEKPDCESSNPDDCKYWCYKGYPAQYTSVPTVELKQDAFATPNLVAEKKATYTKQVIKEPARMEEIIIPAEYKTITKTVLVKDAYTTEEIVPAVFETITKEVLVKKGGLTTWKEVECSLIEYQALPINWNLGSATLTDEAKKLIDERLMTVLENNPGVKLEIASHTDSRGSKTSNQDLSERRALAVVNYLKTKGINESLLVANGYGENKLKNRCSDGVSCTEREHAVNRRTEFRLIQ